MDIVDLKCVQLVEENESSTWHARLGHIGADSMKSMILKELGIGMPHIKIDKKPMNHVSKVNKQGRRFQNKLNIVLQRYSRSFMETFVDR